MSDDREQRRNAIDTLQQLADFYGARSAARAVQGNVAEKWQDRDVLSARRAASILGPREAWRALGLQTDSVPNPSELTDPQQTLGGGGELGVTSEVREGESDDGNGGEERETVQRAFGGGGLQDRYDGEFTPAKERIPSNVDATYTIAVEEPNRIWYNGPIIASEWSIQPNRPDVFNFNEWWVGIRQAEGGRFELLANVVAQDGNIGSPTTSNVVKGDIFGREDATEALHDYLTGLSTVDEQETTTPTDDEPDFGPLQPEMTPGTPDTNPDQQTLGGVEETDQQQIDRQTRQRQQRESQRAETERGQLQLGEQQDRLTEGFGGGSGFAGGGGQSPDRDTSPAPEPEQDDFGDEGMSLSDFGASNAGEPDRPRGPAGGAGARDTFEEAIQIGASGIDERGTMGRLMFQIGWAIHELKRMGELGPSDVSRANSAVDEILLEARERNAITPSDRNRVIATYSNFIEASSDQARKNLYGRFNDRVGDAFGVDMLRADGGGLSGRLSDAWETVSEMGFDGPLPDRD